MHPARREMEWSEFLSSVSASCLFVCSASCTIGIFPKRLAGIRESGVGDYCRIIAPNRFHLVGTEVETETIPRHAYTAFESVGAGRRLFLRSKHADHKNQRLPSCASPS